MSKTEIGAKNSESISKGFWVEQIVIHIIISGHRKSQIYFFQIKSNSKTFESNSEINQTKLFGNMESFFFKEPLVSRKNIKTINRFINCNVYINNVGHRCYVLM